MSRLGGLNVTVKGTFTVDWYTLPLFPANVAFKPSMEVDATTLALPARVSFQTTAPVELKTSALQDAVMLFGNPDTLMEDPFPPAATTAPPTGVRVVVVVAVEADGMDMACGETVSTAPAAACTCSVKLLLSLRPSPVAVTTKATELTVAFADAVNVNVSPLVLTLAGGVCGFADHLAVTPAASPLTE